MKEIFFDFEGHQFDIDFEHNSLNNLYIIYDKISKVPTSRIIEAQNDLVAIRGFENVVKEAKEKNDFSILQLVNLGDINYESKTIFPNEDVKNVCDSEFNFQKFYDECFAWLKAQEED